MDLRPIGVFDSGLGGLTAVRVLQELMPEEQIIYFGDTGRMPYGGRPRAQIRLIARQNIAFAESFGVKAILAACGTISSNAQDILAANGTKIVGVLSPGVKELADTGLYRLGIIATKTSIESGSFERELNSVSPGAEITALACPEFVPMIESGHIDRNDETVKEVVERTLSPLREAKIEALLLGCTHYGIIADAISDYLPGVKLIGAADAAARALRQHLEESDALSAEKRPDSYYTSGSIEDFRALAPLLLGYALGDELKFVPPMPLDGEA